MNLFILFWLLPTVLCLDFYQTKHGREENFDKKMEIPLCSYILEDKEGFNSSIFKYLEVNKIYIELNVKNNESDIFAFENNIYQKRYYRIIEDVYVSHLLGICWPNINTLGKSTVNYTIGFEYKILDSSGATSIFIIVGIIFFILIITFFIFVIRVLPPPVSQRRMREHTMNSIV